MLAQKDASFAGSSGDNGFRLEDLYPEGYVDSEAGKLISTYVRAALSRKQGI